MPRTWHSNMAELLVFTVWSIRCRNRAGASWATRQNNTSVLHSFNCLLIIFPTSTLLMLRDCYGGSQILFTVPDCLRAFGVYRVLPLLSDSRLWRPVKTQWWHHCLKDFLSSITSHICLSKAMSFYESSGFSILNRQKQWHQRFNN